MGTTLPTLVLLINFQINFVTCFNTNTSVIIIKYGVSFTNQMVAILLIPTVEIIVHCLASKFEYFLNKSFMWIGVGTSFFSISNIVLSVMAGINFAVNKNIVNTTGYLKSTGVGLIQISSFSFGLAESMVFTSPLYLICCQTSTSMRGMLVGIFYLARGCFNTAVVSLNSYASPFHCLSAY